MILLLVGVIDTSRIGINETFFAVVSRKIASSNSYELDAS
jgi:hypothetical protein